MNENSQVALNLPAACGKNAANEKDGAGGKDGESDQKSAKPNPLSDPYVKYLRLLSCNWSSHGAAKLLNKDLIKYVAHRIHRCSTPLKVRILISILYISEEIRKDSKADLRYMLSECEMDRDDWVRKISRLLLPYVDFGHIDLRGVDTETVYRTIKYLDDCQKDAAQPFRLKPPLENNKVFDVTKDHFEDFRAADHAAREHICPSSARNADDSLASFQNELPPITNECSPYSDFNYYSDYGQVKYENIISMQQQEQQSGSSQDEQLLFATLPAYELETEAFQADPRFANLMNAIESQGIAEIEKDLRQYKNRFAKRKR